MTWKRVATAAVLIPFVVGIVLWGSTAIVALAVGLVTMLALFEYFALGEAIGHRAYRFWTATCALALIYVQWRTASEHRYYILGAKLTALNGGKWLPGAVSPESPEAGLFFVVLGNSGLSLAAQRPLIASPSACRTNAK